jgi:asparagine synthetase B (glutamine-hydrolysing)
MYWELDYANKVSKSVDACTTSDSISNIPQTTVETRSEEEIIEGVRQRLLEAVKLRLRADVPVGIYLSGGLDSSAIAGMVTHLVHKEGASFWKRQEWKALED